MSAPAGNGSGAAGAVETAAGAATPRIVVVAGGELAPEELAALVVALTPVAPSDGGVEQREPAWSRAARLEGTGAPTVSSAADLATRAHWT